MPRARAVPLQRYHKLAHIRIIAYIFDHYYKATKNNRCDTLNIHLPDMRYKKRYIVALFNSKELRKIRGILLLEINSAAFLPN